MSPTLRIVLAATFALAPSSVAAQVFDPDPVDHTTLWVQVEKPFMEGAADLAVYTSIIEADVVVPLRPGLSLQIGLPLAVAGNSGSGASQQHGNLRLNVLFGEPNEPRGRLGLVLPTGSSPRDESLPLVLGFFTWLNEPEKWIDELLALRGELIRSTQLDDGARLGIRVGGAAITPTEFNDVTFFGRFAGWAHFDTDGARFRVDLETNRRVTTDPGFSEGWASYLALGASLAEVMGRPGLFVRVPLGDLTRDAHGFSVGLTARF